MRCDKRKSEKEPAFGPRAPTAKGCRRERGCCESPSEQRRLKEWAWVVCTRWMILSPLAAPHVRPQPREAGCEA